MKARKISRALFLLIVLLSQAGVICSQQPQGTSAVVETTATPETAATAGQGTTTSYLFVSPHTGGNLQLKEALRKLHSPEEKALIADGRTLACRLEVKARIVKTIGSWTDGVEHSTMLRMRGDEETVRYAAAWLGKRARQKSVLYFQRRSDGTARMYVLSTPSKRRSLPLITKVLERNGISNRTLIPGGRRTLVYVIDFSDELRPKMTAAARELRARPLILKGRGDFIGDDNDRDKAQQVFNGIISGYEQKHPQLPSACAGRATQARVRNSTAGLPVLSVQLNANQF